MKAVASVLALLGVCTVFAKAQQPTKPSGEEGRIIALESAWDQAEQNKDANALDNLLAENLVYVDYDGSISTKQQFLASVKRADIAGKQINNEGVTVHLYGNGVAVSTGSTGTKAFKTANGSPGGRFTNVWLNQNGRWACIASQSTLITR